MLDRTTALVWKTITLGIHRDLESLKLALKFHGCEVSFRANGMLGKPAFTLATEPTEVDLVVRSPSEFGFGSKATYAQIRAKAVELGYELCPAEVGPALRMVYTNQPIDRTLHIAMEAIAGSDGRDRIFALVHDHDDDGRCEQWLDWALGSSDCVRYPYSRFVFVLPRK
jgi:hypothetical protein